MAFASPPALSTARNTILCAVENMAEIAARQGIPIKGTDVTIDFASDALDLSVRYRLIDRHELMKPTSDVADTLSPRIAAAMRLFHRTSQAKAVCVDRRRLLWRGEQAVKKANRPVRKKK